MSQTITGQKNNNKKEKKWILKTRIKDLIFKYFISDYLMKQGEKYHRI